MPSAGGRVEVMTRNYIPDPLAAFLFSLALREVGVAVWRSKPLDSLETKNQPQPAAPYSFPTS